MKALLLTVLVFYATNAFSQSVARLDVKNGFRDYKFGTRITTYPGMVYKSSQYGRTYEKLGEDLKIADQWALSIQYSTTGKGLLYCIAISMERTGLLNLVGTYTKIYGKPEASSMTNTATKQVYNTAYSWHGKNVKLEIIVPWQGSSVGSIMYLNTTLSNLRMNEMYSEEKKSLDDL